MSVPHALNSRRAELCNLEASAPVVVALTVVADVAGCDGAGSNSLCRLRLRLQSLRLCARRRVPRQQAPHRRRSKRLSRGCDDAGDDGAWRRRCRTWPTLKRGSREPRSHVVWFCSVSSHAAFLSRRSAGCFARVGLCDLPLWCHSADRRYYTHIAGRLKIF